MITTYINGIQVDFEPAIVFNAAGGQEGLNYVYIVRNDFRGNDRNDSFSSIAVNTSCSRNICQNGANCMYTLSTGTVCLCTYGFTGTVLN